MLRTLCYSVSLLLSAFPFFILFFSYYFLLTTKEIALIIFLFTALFSRLIGIGLKKIQNVTLSRKLVFKDFYFYLLTAGAVFFIYITVVSIFLLGNPIILHDEWRQFNDYLFNKDLFHSIFDRQNGHLFILPNAIFLFNYYFLEGKEIFLILISIITLCFSIFLFAKKFLLSLNTELTYSLKVACFSVLCLAVFWLAGGETLFWGQGIHDNITGTGAVIAAYGLTRQGAMSSAKTICYFILGAILSSISFSTGNAVWGLGICASILRKEHYKIVFLYLLIGIVGGGITIGYYVLSKSGSSTLIISDFIQFILALLGAPFSQILPVFLPYLKSLGDNKTILLVFSTTIGIIGIFVFLIYLFLYLLSKNRIERLEREKEAISNGILFFILISLFAVTSISLISFGRSGTNLGNPFSERFASWAVIFWYGLFALALIFLSYIKVNKYRDLIIGLIITTVFLFLSFFNIFGIERQLNHYGNVTSAQMDLIVQPNSKGKEIDLWVVNRLKNILWRHEKMVIPVATKLKQQAKNIYSAKWPHLMDQVFSKSFSRKIDQSFNAHLDLSNNEEEPGLVINGWIFPKEKHISFAPRFLVFVNKDVIVGLGVPSVGDRLNIKDLKFDIPTLYRVLYALPKPFCHYLGISNYYYGQTRGLGDDYEEIKIYGIFPDGSYADIITDIK